MALKSRSRNKRAQSVIRRCSGCGALATTRVEVGSRLFAATVTYWCDAHPPSGKALSLYCQKVQGARVAISAVTLAAPLPLAVG